MAALSPARIIAVAADFIPGDIQELCETTWLVTDERQEISDADISKGMEAVFARESRAFMSTFGKLTTVQANVLKGLAEPDHSKVFSGEFMETYRIRKVGSISKALKCLIGTSRISIARARCTSHAKTCGKR